MKHLQAGNHREQVVDRSDFPEERLRPILARENVAILGYGVLGRALARILKNNGVQVVVGCRETGQGWKRAVADGWTPGTDLVSLETAARQGTAIWYLLSDAGQMQYWPQLRPILSPGKALVFGHGFVVVHEALTGVVLPPDIDVVLIAPRGSGTTHFELVQRGQWLNASYAVRQDATGQARERCLALGIACGFGHLLETTFERETRGDLIGERGSLLGAIQGLWMAQYEVLREAGLSPIEAFIETVEEATQSLYPLIGDKGMDWMFANASATAQRGALDWHGRFRDVLKPIFRELFESVCSGKEASRVLKSLDSEAGVQQLQAEVEEIRDSEMWQAGLAVRGLRAPGSSSP